MHSIFRPLLRRRRHHHHGETRRTLVDLASIKWVRDRALDHAVEKERNLKPLLNVKNLLISEPSKTLPGSLIAPHKEPLNLPTRPIDFLRKYPSIFEEFLPGGIGINPHFKLTPQTLTLHTEEQSIYETQIHKQQVANKLLKLLMLTKMNKIPLLLIDRLTWDLGLPQDYAQTLVPEFPDYFRVTRNGSDSVLELVCWIDEMGISVMEQKGMGMPIVFPLQYSRGFEVDKRFKKWVDQWQKLPYVSPYENALHLPATSDEADKWAVAVLHEFLHLLVSKKTDRENVLCLGEWLGLRSRFKRALLQHPGIFYLSSKIGKHTVVLRDGYKRNLLIEKNSLMDMRYKYIHLMNSVKEDKKPKSVQSGSTQQQQQKLTLDSKGGGEEEVQVDEGEDEENGEVYDLSDSEFEDDSDDEEDEGERQTFVHTNAVGDRRRTKGNPKYVAKRSLKTSVVNELDGRYPSKTRKTAATDVSRRTVTHSRHSDHVRSPGRSEFSRKKGRSNLDRRAST